MGRQAIAEIQARLAGAEPGQLSLAGGEAGALSLADGEPGRLTLADEGVVSRDSREPVIPRDLEGTGPEESAVSAPALADSSSPGETKLLGMTRPREKPPQFKT